jgi:hypothetical protein
MNGHKRMAYMSKPEACLGNVTEKLAKGGRIHINPAHEGETRARLGVKEGEKTTTSGLEADKAKAEKTGDTHRIRQDQFAINAKHFHHGK